MLLSIVAAALVVPPMVAMFLLLPRQAPRQLTLAPQGKTRERIVEARKEAMERSTHFEQLLVALGSFELGIVAYVAGVVLAKDASIHEPRTFFGLFTLLTFVTTVAYLHTFRIYCGYSSYTVQLELAGLEKGLRPTTEVFGAASNPPAPAILRPAIALAGSLEIIALYPVFILSASVIAFGRRLGIPWDVITGVVILTTGWSFMYAFPGMTDFVNLARMAARSE